MTRYFLRFSYVGTKFRSSVKTQKTSDNTSVQGALQLGLQSVGFQQNEPIVQISSRTDAGVHALENTAHVDLDLGEGFNSKSLGRVAGSLNKLLWEENLSLRVLDLKEVGPDFSARHFAKKRVYLYRLAFRRFKGNNDGTPPCLHIPISEWGRCHFVSHFRTFNVDAFQEAMQLFPGVKNFIAFGGSGTHIKRSPIRSILSLSMQPGRPLLDSKYDPSVADYEFWDFTVEGQSFLNKQVRRMVSALIAVAQGFISVGDIQRMFDRPSPDSWPNVKVVPAHGLYLVKVVYDPASFCLKRDRTPYLRLVNIIDLHKKLNF